MTDRYIATATTETIPALAGRVVTRSMMVWAANQDSLSAANAALVKWAQDNNFDAVVGVRCEITPDVHGSISSANLGSHTSVSGQTSSRFRYTMYGTAVQYAAA